MNALNAATLSCCSPSYSAAKLRYVFACLGLWPVVWPLARAVHAHIHHRVFMNGNKTIVFPASPGSYASERMG